MMKTLPKNICAHPDGLLVRIRRGETLFQAFVPKNYGRAGTPLPAAGAHGVTRPTDAALQRAIELKEKFLALAGAAKVPVRHFKPRSNTGLLGISETVMWRHSKPYDCFCVSLDRDGKHRSKRVLYGRTRTRERALREAIALRTRHLQTVGRESSRAANHQSPFTTHSP